MSFGEERSGIVTNVRDDGDQYLDEAISKLTGDPAELRAKADECVAKQAKNGAQQAADSTMKSLFSQTGTAA
jgi:hypothetical protein